MGRPQYKWDTREITALTDAKNMFVSKLYGRQLRILCDGPE